MHSDDFYSPNSNNTSKGVPSKIETLDDAIAYLQLARQTMGGNTKFRLALTDYTNDSDEYREVVDVVLRGNRSLVPKSRRDNDDDYVLFVYD